MVLNQDCNLTADLQKSTDCRIFSLELLLWVIQISNFSHWDVLDNVEVTWVLLNCVFVRHLDTHLSFGQCSLKAGFSMSCSCGGICRWVKAPGEHWRAAL